MKTRNPVSADTLAEPELRHHLGGIERAVTALKAETLEACSVPSLAHKACLSVSHFTRLFRKLLALSPVEFLAMARIQRAKELLIRTRMPLQDVCGEVGYRGLGTFTSQFHKFVGTSPGRYRRLRDTSNPDEIVSLCAEAETAQARVLKRRARIEIVGAEAESDMIFVGAFVDMIPKGNPWSGDLLTRGRRECILELPDELVFVLAASVPSSCSYEDSLVAPPEGYHVGCMLVRADLLKAEEWVTVKLRPRQWFDPPVVTSLPLLAARAACSGRCEWPF